MHYRLAVTGDEQLAGVLERALESLWSVDEMRSDYEKLARVCCATEQPVTIARAPKPEIIVEREAAPEVEPMPEEMETFLL
jgi:hypothetical protein